MGSRRSYSAEFKREAVRMVTADRTMSDVARSLGIDRSVLRAWKVAFDKDGDAAFGGAPVDDRDAEIARLRRELQQAREERDILKKAVAYFAKDPK